VSPTGAERNDFLALPLGTFLDQVEARTSAPGGGAVSAVVASMAAGLCAMAARFSQPAEAEPSPTARRARELADAARPLADADAEAYRRFLEARRIPRAPDAEARQAAVAEATSRAAEVPLRVAQLAAEAAGLAAELAASGNPNLKGDAVAGALLAAAAARSAAVLVGINLAGRHDPRVQESAGLAEQADQAAGRALQAAG
jgi:formiminotetrahydrofolate cyclodeaminase